VTTVYIQLHACLRFVSLINVEAALTAQMSPAPAVRPPGLFPVSRRARPTTDSLFVSLSVLLSSSANLPLS